MERSSFRPPWKVFLKYERFGKIKKKQKLLRILTLHSVNELEKIIKLLMVVSAELLICLRD